MDATISVKLRLFSIPKFVIVEPPTGQRQDGMKEAQSFALADLEPETLEALCNEFVTGVFKKAGKRKPPQDFCG